MKTARASLFVLVLVTCVVPVVAEDWPQFRGSTGDGLAQAENPPTTWSDEQNLKWKTRLPGRGASSPIVFKNRVYVTCFTGATEGGIVADMQRHLMCIDRKTGKIVWQSSVDADENENAYGGFVKTHGYASHTPVADDERIYAFFGKSGVIAFDLDGHQLWQTDVGKEIRQFQRGSAASPLLYKDYVIVIAADESQSVLALDKQTGKEIWSMRNPGLDSIYSTPRIVINKDREPELVITTPSEVWGLNPDTGRMLWYVVTLAEGPTQMDSACATAVMQGDLIFALAARKGNAVAIRAGGKGNVTASHVEWSSNLRSVIPSAVCNQGRLYWVDDKGIAHCVNADTGKEINRVRLEGYSDEEMKGSLDRSLSLLALRTQAYDSGFYASVVLAGGKLYAVSRTHGAFVIEASGELKQIAHNRFAVDHSEFNGSPAIVDNEIFLRSDQYLYCLAEQIREDDATNDNNVERKSNQR